MIKENENSMYLVSIYFDKETNNRIQGYINQVAKRTGNTYMLDANVPPHITISAFKTKQIEAIVGSLGSIAEGLRCGTLQWASVGAFLPHVIYLAPVLNEYLHEMSSAVYEGIAQYDNVTVSRYYRPFQWFAHTTIGKKLTQEEMRVAFEVLQQSFGMFKGKVVRIGLAKPNPYKDIAFWDLEE